MGDGERQAGAGAACRVSSRAQWQGASQPSGRRSCWCWCWCGCSHVALAAALTDPLPTAHCPLPMTAAHPRRAANALQWPGGQWPGCNARHHWVWRQRSFQRSTGWAEALDAWRRQPHTTTTTPQSIALERPQPVSRRTPWPSATVESPAAHPLRAYLQPTPAPACHLAPSQRHEQSTSTSKSTALHCTALHRQARLCHGCRHRPRHAPGRH